jgi:transcription elongation factor Elf1
MARKKKSLSQLPQSGQLNDRMLRYNHNQCPHCGSLDIRCSTQSINGKINYMRCVQCGKKFTQPNEKGALCAR